MHYTNPKLEEITVTFHFVRWGARRSARFSRRDVEATLHEWRQIHTAINEAIRRLFDNTLWKPTPGPHCGTCAVAAVCPLGEAAIRSVATLTDGDAEQLAERLITLDAMRDALRDTLKQWVTDRGPVDAYGVRFDFWPTTSWEYNTAQVERIAREAFIDPSLFTKIDTAALARVLRNNPALEAKIDAERARWDPGKRAFSYRKIRENDAA